MYCKKNTNLYLIGIMSRIKITFILFFLVTSIFFCSSSNAALPVNILAWWGYLDSPKISEEIQSRCHVNITYDEYYTNDEFLRRFNSSKVKYDIIIYSDTINNQIKKKIPFLKTELSNISSNYHPAIRKEYLMRGYPQNVVYFMLSLSAFLWSPDAITLTKYDTINSLFNKAENKIVIMMDDPVEAWNLINRGVTPGNFTWTQPYPKTIELTEDNFASVVKNSKVYIINSYNQLYNKSSFAFAFGWTGDEISYMKKSKKNFKILVHPSLSYISTDLLAELNRKKDTECVAKMLSSKSILDIIQRENYYFSPYGDYQSVSDPLYQQIAIQMYENISHLPWLRPIPPEDYNKVNTAWKEIQLNEHQK